MNTTSLTQQTLTDLGLSTLEAKLYMELLRTGPCNASSLGKFAGVSRTNRYHVLAQLEQKGLIARQGGGRKTVFAPAHPNQLESLLDREENEIKAKRRLLRSHLNALVMDYSLAEGQTGVYRFTGMEGLERVYEELLRDRETVNSIVDQKLLRATIADYNPTYLKRRIRLRIRARIICPSRVPVSPNDQREFREVRFVDPDAFPFRMDLKVTRKKIVMTTLGTPHLSGIIIVDPEIVQNYNVLFEFLWNIARTSAK